MITAELLDGLLSPVHRQQAEVHLESISIVDKAQGLVAVLPQLTHEGHILLAAVLLRRQVALLAEQVFLNKLAASDVSLLLRGMVDPLLSLFMARSSARRQVGHVLAELCASLSILSEQDSQLILNQILDQITPSCMRTDIFSLRLLASLADRASTIMLSSGAIQKLQPILASSGSSVRTFAEMAALTEAIVSCTCASEGKLLFTVTDAADLSIDPLSAASRFGSAVLSPLLTKMCLSSSNVSCLEEDSLRQVLQHLSHAAGTCPSLLAGDIHVFSNLVQTCLSLAETYSLQNTTRLAAIEVIAAVCSIPDVKHRILNSPEGALFRSLLLSDHGVLFLCIRFCIDGVSDELDEWALEVPSLVENDAFCEGDDTSLHAEALLGTFVRSLAQSLFVLLPMIEALLSNADWKHQRAGLAVLEQSLLAVPIAFGQFVHVALEAALSLCSSASARVQYQALTFLGVLCELTSVAQPYRILSVVSKALSSSCPKVSAVASLTLVSYGRGVKEHAESMVVPFLQDVMVALLQGPLSLAAVDGTRVDYCAVVVKIRAIGAVTVMADSAGSAFLPFYPLVMSGLLACAKLDNNAFEICQLRGAAIEAMAIVGQSIGNEHRETFLPHAEQIMGLAVPLLQTESASISRDQLLSSCARVASVLGHQYVPFVDAVLPHLFNRMQESADIEYSEGDEAGLEATRCGQQMDSDDGVESMTLALPGKGLTKVTINVTKMQETAEAARALYEHADALDEAFGPYAQASLQVLIPLIGFQYSGDVRSTVAQACGAVFNAACLHGEASSDIYLAQESLPVLVRLICKQMFLEDTRDLEVVLALAESLSDILYFAYSQLRPDDRTIIAKFTVDNGRDNVKHLMRMIVACFERRSKLFQTLTEMDDVLSGEDERSELTKSLEQEQAVLTALVDSVGYILKFFRERFVPAFEELVAPFLGMFLKASSTTDSRALFASLCLFDDLVEHCGSVAANKFSALLAEGILIGVDDDKNGGDDDVKRVSLYGISQLARFGSTSFLESHAQGLTHMLLEIASVAKEEAENLFIVENAVSALCALLLFEGAPFVKLNIVDFYSVLPVVLSQLPLRQDQDQARICHANFCAMVKHGQVSIITHAEEVLRVIGSTLEYINEGEDIGTPETQDGFAEILWQMQREVPPARMQQAFQSLSCKAQHALKEVLF